MTQGKTLALDKEEEGPSVRLLQRAAAAARDSKGESLALALLFLTACSEHAKRGWYPDLTRQPTTTRYSPTSGLEHG